MTKESLSEKMIKNGTQIPTIYVKEFIKKRLERIDLIIKMYPHKSGEELAGQLKEDLMNDAGEKLI